MTLNVPGPLTIMVDVPTESKLYDIEIRDAKGDNEWRSMRLFRNPFGSPNRESVVEIVDGICNRAQDGMHYRVVEYATTITKTVLE